MTVVAFQSDVGTSTRNLAQLAVERALQTARESETTIKRQTWDSIFTPGCLCCWWPLSADDTRTSCEIDCNDYPIKTFIHNWRRLKGRRLLLSSPEQIFSTLPRLTFQRSGLIGPVQSFTWRQTQQEEGVKYIWSVGFHLSFLIRWFTTASLRPCSV